jgi:tetratricopeptide (TPR) repeat protein
MDIEEPPAAIETGEQDFSDLDDLSFDLGASDTDDRETTADLGFGDFVESKDKSEKFIEIHEATYQVDEPLSEESRIVKELEHSKSDSAFILEEDPNEITTAADPVADEASFEIEMEEPDDTGNVPIDEINDRLLNRSQNSSTEPEPSFSDDAFDVDSVIDGTPEPVQEVEPSIPDISLPEEASAPDIDSPFQEIEQTDIPFEDDEELLKADGLFIEDDLYFEVEKNVLDELQSIAFWLKELEKQRTTTIEKNMIEIFDEFKKGIDEKIGQEDYDTRYNLGIAYKEMGLIEEAIHEFLISAKHPSKFFDSAGLLGMCFMEKGMLGEAVGWYEKAVETPERKAEEYLAIKYELVLALKSKEDYGKAGKVIEDMMRTHPSYRNIAQIHQEIKSQNGNIRT